MPGICLRPGPQAASLAVLSLVVLASEPAAAVVLRESATDKRAFSVRSRLQVEGRIQTTTPGGSSIGLNLHVDAKLSYLERRLPPAGKEAETLRAMRHYGTAQASIDVGGRKTTSRLSDSRKLMVAEGQRSGVRTWAPDGPMTYDMLELLRTPGDSLALLGLLPDGEVAAGSRWESPDWVISMLTGVEAVSTSELKCHISRLDGQYAVIELEGSVEGAVLGAFTKIAVSGQVACDLKHRFLRQAKITQTEERAVGAVSPGMKVTATMYVDRQVAESYGELTDSRLASVPVNPSRQDLSLVLNSPWSLRFAFGRAWHVFHQTGDVIVLRLMENGGLVAQCNVSQLASAPPGSHLSEQDFQADVRSALKEQLSGIQKAEQLRTADGRYLYRITAVGRSRNVPMHWYYYLCAAADGRQAAFVFAIESRFVDQLAGRDAAIVESLQFTPVQAAGRETPSRQSDPVR